MKKNIVIVLLAVAVLGLGGFVVYDKVLKKDEVKENDNSNKNQNPIIKYEKINNNEIEELFTTNKTTLDLLNTQGNDVENVGKLLEKNGNYVIEESYLYLSHKAYDENKELTEISKNEILETSKKLFGYDLDLDFNDISDSCDSTGKTIGLKYNKETDKYEVMDGAFECGWNNQHEWYFRNLKINNDDQNIYTVTAEQIWTDEVGNADVSYHYYGTYNDAVNETNSILSLSENELNTIWDEYNDGVQDAILDKIEKSNTYEYKIVKENGNIKVLSYKKTIN